MQSHCLVSAPLQVCVLVGTMTSVMHVFQVLVDRKVDAENEIRTTAVFSPSTTTVVLAIVCGTLYLGLITEIGLTWSLTAFVPLALHLVLSSTERASMLSRIYFGVVLIITLAT